MIEKKNAARYNITMLPLILSGGSGTRLWPLSTPAVPKQFLPLLDGNATLLQQTARRLDRLPFLSAPLVICNERHLSLVREQLSAFGELRRPVMLEPIGRNTAPAIAAAALYALEEEADGLMLVLASDHAVRQTDAFRAAVSTARKVAASGKYALFGIVPSRAETGYGYIETEPVSDAAWLAVRAFKEKPDAETAERYVAAGTYFWNSGMFVIPAQLLLDELSVFAPAMLALVRQAYARAERTRDVIALDRESFEQIEGDSIDYAVMERTRNAVVVPLDAGWSDVGSWDMVWELSKQDANGNVIHGAHAFMQDSSGNLVFTADAKRVALLGLHDCVVVEGEAGLLIADKRHVQAVRQAAEVLREKP